MTAKRFIAALGLALASLTASAQNPQVIRYQEYPGSILHIVNWAMVDKGFCTKQNLKCEPVYLANGPLAQQAAAAGSVDIIYSSLDVMMQAVAKGNDLQIIGAQVPNNVYSLAVGKDVPQPNRAAGYPANVRDLKGKRIGVSARGSGTEMYVKSLLSGAGLEPDSVTYVAVGSPNTAYAALVAKQVDAILSWDPVPALCASTQQCTIAVDLRKGEGPPEIKAMNGGFLAWQARREYVQKHEATVDAFLRALAEATVWVQDPKNYAEVRKLAEKNFKLGEVPNREQVMDQIVKESIASLGTKFDRKVIPGFNAFLLKNKVIDKPLDAEAIVYKKAP
jgi:NitT/TauT family transport system substrate-binding protein